MALSSISELHIVWRNTFLGLFWIYSWSILFKLKVLLEKNQFFFQTLILERKKNTFGGQWGCFQVGPTAIHFHSKTKFTYTHKCNCREGICIDWKCIYNFQFRLYMLTIKWFCCFQIHQCPLLAALRMHLESVGEWEVIEECAPNKLNPLWSNKHVNFKASLPFKICMYEQFRACTWSFLCWIMVVKEGGF